MNKQRKCACEPGNREHKWYRLGNGRFSVDVKTGDVFIAKLDLDRESGYSGDVKLDEKFNYCPVCGGTLGDYPTFEGEGI